MSMQIVEKSGEGLSRIFGVTVPAATLSERLDQRIAEIRPQMNIKGFRPGKVPAAHVKRLYGKSLMGEIVDQAVSESQQQALSTGALRPAASPEINLSSDLEQVLAGSSDLSFELSVELMPEFTVMDVSTIALDRPVYQPTDSEIDEQIKEIADQNLSYEPKTGKAVKAAAGDMVVGDFVGRIDGAVFEGGSMENAEVVIGSGRFIPGFEDQLTGAKPDTTVTIGVTFPDDYGAAELAGKAAEFEFQVKEIKKPKATAIDDAFAKSLGLGDLDALKAAVRGQLEQQYAEASRFKAKRALLDALDSGHSFDLPPKMVEGEFATIWSQVEAEKAAGELSDEDKAKTDDQLKAEYRKIAERRVRLGLVLAEIGRLENVQVEDQELNRALIAEARKYPGQEQQVVEFYRSNPQATAQLRAPIYEEKVVDLLLAKAKVTDKPVTKEALFADDELPEGYGDAPKAEAAKPAKRKSAPKKAAAEAPAED
jgi:trigger factor